jgi:hypothetical protein
LIGHYEFTNFGDLEYLLARLRIDELCGKILENRVTRSQAEGEYIKIEGKFSSAETDKLELFKMIYGGRIRRLCDQYLEEAE